MQANRAMDGNTRPCYCSFAYSALACFKMGMSGSVPGDCRASRKLQIKGVNFLAADVAQHKRGIIRG